jgi:hypothetical protein
LRELVEDVNLFIACDKGNSRKGINSFVKYICGYDEKQDRVVKYVLDIDVADGKNEDAAEAIDDSLSKIDQQGRPKIRLVGQGTDGGGGGVGVGLYVCLKSKDRTAEFYLIATCSLHGWQRVLGNAIEACSGSGGLLKRDVLQMLHTVYQIQGEYEIDEFKGMWRLISGKAFQTMPKPNIGRWGSVGDAGDNLLERWDDWQAMAVSIINNCNTDINANTFASWADSYLNDPSLKAQLLFIVAFHRLVWNKHFVWLMDDDERTKTAGFRSVDMPVRAYLMHRDIKNLQASWRTKPEYTNYFDIVNALPVSTEKEQQIKQVLESSFPNKFFEVALNTFDSNFHQWLTDNLQLTMGGDNLPAQAFASWLRGEEYSGPASYESRTHDTTIEVGDMIAYLTAHVSPGEMRLRRFFQDHSSAIGMLAAGDSVWGDVRSSDVLAFRKFIKQKWFGLPSHTQFVEGGVKEAKRCAATNRNEQMRSSLATQRCLSVHAPHSTAKESRRTRELRGNASMTAGLAGQRKRKLEGGGEEHETLNQKKIQPTVSGAYRTSEILKETLNSHQTSKGISAEDRKELKKKLFAKENTYESRRINAKLEQFDERRNTHKAPNQIQRQLPGMDLTPLVRGRIPFSKVRVNLQKDNVLEELRSRLGDDFVLRRDLDVMGVQTLVDNFLKPNEIERMGDGGDVDVVDFDPRHKPMDEWGILWKKRKQT